jgi:histidinol-phosphate aminotransferase
LVKDSQLTQDKASERLNNMEIIQEEVNTILSERELLAKKIKDISLVEKVYVSDANFLLVKVDDADKRYSELVKKGIVVRNRTTQALCENCLRFTVGTEAENEKLIEVLNQL